MSGEKMAFARLEARAQRDLERAIEMCRKHEANLAKTANLAGRARAVLADVDQEMAEMGQAAGFRESLQTFQQTAALFEEHRRLVRSELDAIAALRGRPARASESLGEVQQRREKVGELMTKVADLAVDMENRVQSTRAGLQAEGRSRDYRAGAVDRGRRGRLEGLLEELDSRLHAAAECSLGWASGRALALRVRVEGLRRRSAPVSESDVALCGEELSVLVGEAERRYAEDQERLEIFRRVALALRGAGFEAADESRFDATQDAIVGSHFRRRGGVSAEVQVFRGGRIRLFMNDAKKKVETDLNAEDNAIWDIIANVPKDLEVDRVEWAQPQGPPIRLAVRKRKETSKVKGHNPKGMEQKP